MNTFEKIHDMCDKLNDNIKNNNIPFTKSQSLIILGTDADNNETFQFGCGSILNIIFSIDCLLDVVTKETQTFSREDIIRILSTGGDEE